MRSHFKIVLKYLFTLLSFLFLSILLLHFFPQYLHTSYCRLVLPLIDWKPRVERLLDCSNVDQTILHDFDNKITVKQSEYLGWNFITLEQNEPTGSFRIKVKFERDKLVFFPRANSQNDTINVYEIVDDQRLPLFIFRGNDKGWSPVGSQYELKLGCLKEAFLQNVYTCVLEIELSGPYCQIWIKDNSVFFN